MDRERISLSFFLHFTGNFQALVHGPSEKCAQTAVKKSKATDNLQVIVQIAALDSAVSTESEPCAHMVLARPIPH